MGGAEFLLFIHIFAKDIVFQLAGLLSQFFLAVSRNSARTMGEKEHGNRVT
jgi:hypothetical protein